MPHTNSTETFRNVVFDKASGVFQGMIRVAQDAQKTDAAQSFKGLLLEKGASVNSVPQLEIYADDVKCAHGATVGELDRQALFYMASRGMDPATAKTLLLKAFVAGVFDDVSDEAVKDRLEAAAIAKLETQRKRRAQSSKRDERKASKPGVRKGRHRRRRRLAGV